MTTEEKLKHVRFQIKWYTDEAEKNLLCAQAHRLCEAELVEAIEGLKPDCLCNYAIEMFDGIHHDQRCALYKETELEGQAV
jgi:hypothetical protein